ncbi:hypothetical protein Pse7429DRAFT_4021 [Pseudanabaena biceps PCC 7429]|uniref:Uncharacterized protein n=1 Tax=Pseudanabaena biceps PCC 7429 TaxID=927668 RepID=L8MSH4_9CYAN|nr:hypothetical protein Pse7429DRAFT_4021 [Pseudanabaena biceps PCC 7429]
MSDLSPCFFFPSSSSFDSSIFSDRFIRSLDGGLDESLLLLLFTAFSSLFLRIFVAPIPVAARLLLPVLLLAYFLGLLVHIAVALSSLYFSRFGSFVNFLPDSLRNFDTQLDVSVESQLLHHSFLLIYLMQ